MAEGSNLAVLAGADALVAFLLGYRVAALRVTRLRDALWSAATYALAIAIGAAALRAMEIPRLIGPALLTLVFYLWDAFHGASARRRDRTWIWQTVLLGIAGSLLGLRGSLLGLRGLPLGSLSRLSLDSRSKEESRGGERDRFHAPV